MVTARTLGGMSRSTGRDKSVQERDRSIIPLSADFYRGRVNISRRAAAARVTLHPPTVPWTDLFAVRRCYSGVDMVGCSVTSCDGGAVMGFGPIWRSHLRIGCSKPKWIAMQVTIKVPNIAGPVIQCCSQTVATLC